MADLLEIALNVVRVAVARALETGATRQDIDRTVNEAIVFRRQQATTTAALNPEKPEATRG